MIAMQGVGDAFVRIVKDDGIAGLFRGATPTIVRAMALNMGMLASNDQVRPCHALKNTTVYTSSRMLESPSMLVVQMSR
jgi:hypothetical protein